MALKLWWGLRAWLPIPAPARPAYPVRNRHLQHPRPHARQPALVVIERVRVAPRTAFPHLLHVPANISNLSCTPLEVKSLQWGLRVYVRRRQHGFRSAPIHLSAHATRQTHPWHSSRGEMPLRTGVPGPAWPSTVLQFAASLGPPALHPTQPHALVWAYS